MPSGQRAPLNEWNVEGMRLSLFASSPVKPQPGAWNAVTGEQPQMTANQAMAGLVQEQGSIANGTVALITQQTLERLDCIFAPTLQNPGFGSGPPAILGSPSEALDVYSRLMTKLVASLSFPCKRIAVGLAFRLPVANKEEGYQRLASYLANAPDPTAFDFAYQINRRRQSKGPSVHINRLSKWAVQAYQTVLVNPMNPVAQVPVDDLRHACRLELDINTAAERTQPFPAKELEGLFKESMELAVEIVEKGDIP